MRTCIKNFNDTEKYPLKIIHIFIFQDIKTLTLFIPHIDTNSLHVWNARYNFLNLKLNC